MDSPAVSVLDDILKAPRRERGGAVGTNRIAFQRDWALSLLLQLHGDGVDYVLLCEVHDDVCLLEGTPPTSVTFFQVKTLDDGHWTLTKLLKKPVAKSKKKAAGKGATKSAGALKNLSIISALYQNAVTFGAAVKALCLVSNARYDVALADSAQQSKHLLEIPVSQLDATSRIKIEKALQSELSAASLPCPLCMGCAADDKKPIDDDAVTEPTPTGPMRPRHGPDFQPPFPHDPREPLPPRR